MLANGRAPQSRPTLKLCGWRSSCSVSSIGVAGGLHTAGVTVVRVPRNREMMRDHQSVMMQRQLRCDRTWRVWGVCVQHI